jgi:hypothetical protein
MPKKQTQFSWRAPEYEKEIRGNGWFISLAVLAAVMLGYSIFAQSWTFTVLIVLFVVVYVMAHRREPKEVTIDISEIGVQFGKKTFPFENLKTFWVSRFEHNVTINTKSKLVPQFTISLRDIEHEGEEIRQFLGQHITEVEEPEPSILDNIYRTLGI